MGFLNIIILSICEFDENEEREGLAFLMSINKLNLRVYLENF